jgi:hypothetical protein
MAIRNGIIVNFNKARAEQLLNCLRTGAPIAPRGQGWAGNDMLALAGACFYAAMSQGPASFWLRDIPDNLHAEHTEAEVSQFLNDLRAAIEFYSELTRLVHDDEYDEKCDPDVIAKATQEGEVRRSVTPLRGFKQKPRQA